MTRKKTIPELGPLEFTLLRILWKRPAVSAREVLDAYNRHADKPLKYTTVMTLLTRMAEKGVLEVDRQRQPFQFSPVVGREQMLRQRVREFVDVFFDGRPSELALRLVEEGPLSDETLRRLEATLRRHRESSGSGDGE